MTSTDEVLGSVHASEMLGISVATITRWVKDGRIVPLTKLPGLTGAFVFTRAEVERVAAEKATA